MLNTIRMGSGRRLLLLHGIGASWRSWTPVMEPLSKERELIAIDLPAHGESARETGSDSFRGVTDSVERYICDNDLAGVDVVGSSLGGRIALELARRGRVGDVVALDPGGFWRGWERSFLEGSLLGTTKVLRALRSQLPMLMANPVSRSMMLAQLSARPWALDPDMLTAELRNMADLSIMEPLVKDLAHGPEQEGPAVPPTGIITLGWGRQDRLCLPQQALRACRAFPTASVHWFIRSGHMPIWDQPQEAARLILSCTGSRAVR